MSTSETTRASALWSTDLCVPGSGQHGRAFLTADLVGRVSVDDLQAYLAKCFVEEDDESRIPLLEQAIQATTVTVETYPGESTPVEYHAYIRAPQVSDAPIFACVLVSSAVVAHLLSMQPHVVVETATLQVVGDPFTHASIVAAMEDWVSRVWPGRPIPRMVLSPWPGPAETKDASVVLLRHFARRVPKITKGEEVASSFSPPRDLVASEYRWGDDAA